MFFALYIMQLFIVVYLFFWSLICMGLEPIGSYNFFQGRVSASLEMYTFSHSVTTGNDRKSLQQKHTRNPKKHIFISEKDEKDEICITSHSFLSWWCLHAHFLYKGVTMTGSERKSTNWVTYRHKRENVFLLFPKLTKTASLR